MNKKVFVLGAGASKEVGLPIGAELKETISTDLNIKFDDFGTRLLLGDRVLADAMGFYQAYRSNPPSNTVYPLLKEAWKISDGLPLTISIDNFIDIHAGNKEIEVCGKLAISKAILEAEANSRLMLDTSDTQSKLNFAELEKTWFSKFFKLVTENCQKEDLKERLSSIAFIVFNYDRCLEHYLFHAVKTLYSIDNQEASDILNAIEIYHPYGTVGSLPWQGLSGRSVEFGGKPHPQVLVDLIEQIKTFTEGTDPNSSEISRIRGLVASASDILFLGFAFHKLNLDVIFHAPNPNAGKRSTRVFATATGISNYDRDEIIAELIQRGIHQAGIILRNDIKCTDLFYEFGRALRFSN